MISNFLLVATAWNLADNPDGVVGFSGTNDTCLLLPLQLQEIFPSGNESQSLIGTNGKMIELILRNPKYSMLESNEDLPVWKIVLNHVISTNANALIDAGALMAGVTNKSAAEYIVDKIRQRERSNFKGVVYYETLYEEWFIINFEKQSWPLSLSPIEEKDAIIFFDESHCRGAI